MLNLKRLLFSLIFLWTAVAVMGQGIFQPVHKRWEVSFFGGASFFSDKDLFTPVEGQDDVRLVGLDAKSGWSGGLRITENLNHHVGAELEYAFANQPAQFRNLRPGFPATPFDQSVHKISYSLLLYPLDRYQRYRPYGSLGAGASYFQVDADPGGALQGVDLKSRWKAAFSYGGGVKVHLRDQWGARFDFRNHVTGVPDYGLPRTAPVLPGGVTGPALRPEGRIQNWQLSLGFLYTWGER